MFKDLKKFISAKNVVKWRSIVKDVPAYYDGLERLHDRIHPRNQSLRVSDIQELSHDTKLIRFISNNPNKPLAPFRAGQYIGLNVEINGVRTSRPYSLVSSPNQQAYYELGIKKKEGGFVSPYLLENLKVGDLIEATEPMGNMYYNEIFHGKNLVFIAGGCGITPFISLLRNISENLLPLNVWVLFGCLTQGDILFKEELEDVASRRPHIKIDCVLSEPDPQWKGSCGFISKDIISSFIGSVDDKYFYIVGNRAMYQFILGELESLNVARHRIAHEAFGVPDDITQSMGWPKEIDASKKVAVTVDYIQNGKEISEVIPASCTEPLLNSIERAKLPVTTNSGCRSGECALCRTKLISGKVYVPPIATIREIDDEYGFIHPCISYPLRDLHLDLRVT